jgi:hypothetical protein
VEAIFPLADIPATRASLRIHPLVAEAVPRQAPTPSPPLTSLGFAARFF